MSASCFINQTRRSERGHDAVDTIVSVGGGGRHERGHGGRGVYLLIVLRLLDVGPDGLALGEPALHAPQRLHVCLVGRVLDRLLLEPLALALLPVPHQPRLALPSSIGHGYWRRGLRRRHLKTIAFSETEHLKGHECSLLSMTVIRCLRCGSWSGWSLLATVMSISGRKI
jgi:hypothetical protein